MHELWYLYIDNSDNERIEFEHLPIFYEQLMAHSAWAGLPNSWWRNYSTFTKSDYKEFVSLLGDPLDIQKLESLPEEKEYFYKHDECISYAEGLLSYFQENKKVLEEEYLDDMEMFEGSHYDDLRDPNNMKNVMSDLELLKKKLNDAKDRHQGFWLNILVDY